jgi:hypothetical protein
MKAPTGIRVTKLGAPGRGDHVQETLHPHPVVVEAEPWPSPGFGIEHEEEGRVVRAIQREATQLVAGVLMNPFQRGEALSRRSSVG